MGYPYVAARYDYGPRKGPAAAFVVHMAEGGGTVAYLAGKPARGVSVHYVIEYSGRTVRMLDESHASGSINPLELRSSDDADGFFGATAARACLGAWWDDPNSAVISVEIEGFASSGPTKAQAAALVALVDDLRTRYPRIGLLGHRDFTTTKACPGRLIPWDALGGHGPSKGDDVPITITIDRYPAPRQARGTNVTGYLPDGTRHTEPTWSGLVSGTAHVDRTDDAAPKGSGFVVGASRPFTTYLIPAAELTIDPAPVADCSAAINAALDHVAGPAAAVTAAIAEARPR